MGVKSGLTAAFVVDGPTRAAMIAENPECDEILKPFLNGRHVRRYFTDSKNLFLVYTYHGIDIQRYPAVEKHLRPFKNKLEKRATKQAWYELQQPQLRFAPLMNSPKIIFPDIATGPRFTLDTNAHYGANTVYFIPMADLILLAILNSTLATFYFRTVCAGLEDKNSVYLRFFGQYLEHFPVRMPEDKNTRSAIVSLVENMLSLQERLTQSPTPQEKRILQQQIEITDRQIDQLVYQLYTLTDGEIETVQSATT